MEKVHEFLHNIIIFRRRDISERKRPSRVPVQYSFFQAFRPVRVRRGHYTIQPSQSQPSKMPFFFTRVIDFSLAHLVIQHRSVMRAPCAVGANFHALSAVRFKLQLGKHFRRRILLSGYSSSGAVIHLAFSNMFKVSSFQCTVSYCGILPLQAAGWFASMLDSVGQLPTTIVVYSLLFFEFPPLHAAHDMHNAAASSAAPPFFRRLFIPNPPFYFFECGAMPHSAVLLYIPRSAFSINNNPYRLTYIPYSILQPDVLIVYMQNFSFGFFV